MIGRSKGALISVTMLGSIDKKDRYVFAARHGEKNDMCKICCMFMAQYALN